MGTSNYIPTGRTSLVKKDMMELQVQTEYAHRPNPRITTTITRDGQVVHKVERSLDRQIASQEEQERAENTIKRQHAEVVSIIRNGSSMTPPQPDPAEQTVIQPRSVYDKLAALPGVQRIYSLDNEGNFRDTSKESQFRQAFAAIFKNLHELMNLFERKPGVGYTRRQGVYEVERDRLYFVSVGLECYFVFVGRVDYAMDYEKAIKQIILDQI